MIPLYLFSEHNEAFYYYHKAKYEDYIRQPMDLFHVDAHNDMGFPKVFKKPLYYSPQNPNNKYKVILDIDFDYFTCRSSISGYCPKDYAEFIEDKLKKRLVTAFSDINIIS